MSYSKIYNYDDFISFLSGSGYKEASKKQKDSLDAELELQLASLERDKNTINQNYDDLARQAYVSYMATSRSLPGKINKAGLNGGAADNLYTSLANEYNNNYNEIGKERLNKLNEKSGEITEAKLENSRDYSKALSELYSSAIEDFLNIREAEEQRGFEGYYNDKELAQQEADRKAEIQMNKDKIKSENSRKEYDYLLEKAKLALQAGDFEYLKELGIQPPNLSSSGGSTSSGGSVGTGNMSYSDLAKQLEYAVELAGYGNFTLLCQITGMTEKEAALKFADQNSRYSETDIQNAAKLFMSGDYSKNVLKVMKAAYPDYTYAQMYKLWESIAMYDWLIDLSGGYRGPNG